MPQSYKDFLNDQKKTFSFKGFRNVNAKYFERNPDKFFLNFLESPRTFETQYRFAGKEHNSGFYFASSEEVLKSEMDFYGEKNKTKHNKNFWNKIFGSSKQTDENILIEAEIELENVMDLTNPVNVYRLLVEGYSKIQTSRLLVSDFLMFTIAANKGGNWFTDNLGLELKREGYNGIIFPSIRAFDSDFMRESLPYHPLQFEKMSFPTNNGVITDTFYSGLLEIHAGDMMGLRDDILNAVKKYYNVVIFSGSKTTSSIKKVLYKERGKERKIDNIFFKKSDRDIERERLLEKNKLGIDIHEAFQKGLIEDYLIEVHLTGEISFVNPTE